jgi:hypothetical protein
MVFVTQYPLSRLVPLLLCVADNKAPAVLRAGSKRSRASNTEDLCESLCESILDVWDKAELYVTFRTLVDRNFYLLLADQTEHASFSQITLLVCEFRTLLNSADELMYSGRLATVFDLFSEPMYNLLANAQQVLLLFIMGCNSNRTEATKCLYT